MWEKVTDVYFVILMQVPLPPTRRDALIPLSFGSTRKGLKKTPAPQNLSKWGSTSPTIVKTDTTFSTPRMVRYNSTKKKWFYHTLTPKKTGRGLLTNRLG